MKKIGIIICVLGCLGMGCANIGAVIYFIYEYAGQDASFKPALWGAFKIWAFLFPGGIVLTAIGFYITETN